MPGPPDLVPVKGYPAPGVLVSLVSFFQACHELVVRGLFLLACGILSVSRFLLLGLVSLLIDGNRDRNMGHEGILPVIRNALRRAFTGVDILHAQFKIRIGMLLSHLFRCALTARLEGQLLKFGIVLFQGVFQVRWRNG